MGPLWVQSPWGGPGLLLGQPPLPRPARVPTLTCSMSSHSSRPTKMSSRGSRWRVPLLLTRNHEVTLILALMRPVWPWGWEESSERGPPPPRPRPLGTLKARSEPALLGLKHLHSATTAAAFRKAGLQASPSRTMPVLHRPPPRLRSPLMLWAHVYPLLCLGARAQEGGGAVVPEVLGADVVGGLGGGPLPAAQRRVTTSTSSQTHSYHTRMHTASKHTRSTAHKLPSHDPGAGVRTRRHHPGLWGPHTVPASWGFLPAGRQAPRRGAACAKVPATQRNKGTGSAGGGGPSKAGGGEVGTRAPGAALQAEGRAKAQMLGHACLGVQWLAQERSRRPGGPRACCHPGC